MYRKTKATSPHFRLPNPHDPVTGDYGPLTLSALLCRFELLEDLDTSMDRAEAVTKEQWGYGGRHSYHDTIKVLNYIVDEGPPEVYRFEGKEGEFGLAYWDTSQRWVILDIATYGLIGGCLAEDHKGRGLVFEIYLGKWNPATHRWDYDTDTKVKAIDWRYDVPYPDAGATGLFEARASDEYGTIYETVALDCDTPGECGD